jgi:hypothetical protein
VTHSVNHGTSVRAAKGRDGVSELDATQRELVIKYLDLFRFNSVGEHNFLLTEHVKRNTWCVIHERRTRSSRSGSQNPEEKTILRRFSLSTFLFRLPYSGCSILFPHRALHFTCCRYQSRPAPPPPDSPPPKPPKSPPPPPNPPNPPPPPPNPPLPNPPNPPPPG